MEIPPGVSLVGAGMNQTIIESEGVLLKGGITPNSPGYKEHFQGSLIQLISDRRKDGRPVPPEAGNQKVGGFSIQGNSTLKAGLWVQNRNDVEISNMEILDCDYRGAVVTTGNQSGTGSYFLTGIKVHDLFFQNSGKELEDETLGNLCLGSLDGADVYNIEIEDEVGYGINCS